MKGLKIIINGSKLPTKKEIEKKVETMKKTPMISKMKSVASNTLAKKKA